MQNELSQDLEFYFYSIEEGCISCGECWRQAPNIIHSHPIETKAVITRQPKSIEDLEHAERARSRCPVSVIQREKCT